MSTGLVYSDRFLEHDTGPGHPERPDRLRAIVERLRSKGLWDRFKHLEFGPAPLDAITALHDAAYLTRIEAACVKGHPYIDSPDSAIGPESFEIARLATGGVLAAVDAVRQGDCQNALCLVRPPGHHAERDRSMGFCLFDHIAIAAEHLISHHGVERVAIVDFDVHHGNGTQHLFEHRSNVLFISLHEDPRTLYPGTGFAEETGKGEGEGYTLNIAMPAGAGDAEYQHAFETSVLPRLAAFKPQWLLVSAGFDAATDDPLAHMEVSAEGFAWMSRALVDVAGQFAEGRLVAMLEGGYDLASLAAGVEQLAIALLDAPANARPT